MIKAMFVKVVKGSEDSIALQMSMEYVPVLRRAVATTVPSLLDKISKDPSNFNEVHLWLLLRLQPKFHFKHAFTLIQLLEENDLKSNLFKQDGLLLKMSNPLMVLALATDIFQRLRLQFRSLALRINAFNDVFEEKFITIYENVYDA